MKIALKYGLLITAVVVAWVVGARYLLGIGPNSRVGLLEPILFNLAAIAAIYLAMKARKREAGGELGFKDGLKTGMAVSLVYAVSACLLFMIEFLVAGPRLLLSEAGPQNAPLWQVVVGAYAGLFFGSLFFGLIYSTLIAFFLARQMRNEPSEII